MSDRLETTLNMIQIPAAPISWPGIYMGREVELTPVGCSDLSAQLHIRWLIDQAQHHVPGIPFRSDNRVDRFMIFGRMYQEMTVFLEVAGLTCRSAEALAWVNELWIQTLDRVKPSRSGGRQVVFCHTPSDYGDLLGDGEAHSTGCHFNLLSPRPLEMRELSQLATLIASLNCVFGPGGLSREVAYISSAGGELGSTSAQYRSVRPGGGRVGSDRL